MYQINEGRFTVPAGFEDKSTTVLQGVGGDKQLSLTVIRDVLEDHEGINEYVVRQLGELKKRLPGYKMLDKKTAFLGGLKRPSKGCKLKAATNITSPRYSNGRPGLLFTTGKYWY
ncbi:Uncharacterized conserved protein [Yersinia pseudotuberculosis]|uniref:Uncharacterized conserved protein n=1 Tax=Yersinia pseudotuberculosis TaxID=633 RepID=A0A380Q3K1_YERPU|nr:DcrB-related protein [Yersinia pseudotuberculosis]SUP80356.1 Uncharacterized conserved protein [Yersinia pseudotuberculosis]